MGLTNWKIQLEIERYEDGYSISGRIQGGEVMKYHKPTQADVMTFLDNNLPAIMNDLETKLNPA